MTKRKERSLTTTERSVVRVISKLPKELRQPIKPLLSVGARTAKERFLDYAEDATLALMRKYDLLAEHYGYEAFTEENSRYVLYELAQDLLPGLKVKWGEERKLTKIWTREADLLLWHDVSVRANHGARRARSTCFILARHEPWLSLLKARKKRTIASGEGAAGNTLYKRYISIKSSKHFQEFMKGHSPKEAATILARDGQKFLPYFQKIAKVFYESTGFAHPIMHTKNSQKHLPQTVSENR